jgi:hypothetical protein
VAHGELVIEKVSGKTGIAEFVDLAYRLHAGDPSFVPELRGTEIKKYTPGQNPFFEHARCQLFLARRNGAAVGRISAHIDELALSQPPEQGMGPGTGNWGALEAVDAGVADQLIAAAEDWLRDQGMTRVLAPLTLSIWEQPGVLVKGYDHPPMVMMGHNLPEQQDWIEARGYTAAKTLRTYELDITQDFPPLIRRIVASGEKNARIRVREVDLRQYDRDVKIICDILNDAWSDNWGFVPFTQSEVAVFAKELKPLVRPDLIRIAEYDGEPVAFMMTLPDLNRVQQQVSGPRGKPSPLGWIKLLLWLRRPRPADMRVPLMGVVKRLQATRMASQLAFMMIEYIRRAAVRDYLGKRGEIGWILDDNQGMNAIAEAIDSDVNREYVIYDKPL